MDEKVKAQLQALYGNCAKGDYQIGDQIRWPGGQGEIIWIQSAGNTPVTGKHHGLYYVVDSGGFPDLVAPTDILPE